MRIVLKVDIDEIAQKMLNKNLTNEELENRVIEELAPFLSQLTEQVKERMDDLSHPEPRNSDEEREKRGEF